jgi:hypothetical protein
MQPPSLRVVTVRFVVYTLNFRDPTSASMLHPPLLFALQDEEPVLQCINTRFALIRKTFAFSVLNPLLPMKEALSAAVEGVLDDYLSKKEALKRAVNFVEILVGIDVVVVNNPMATARS